MLRLTNSAKYGYHSCWLDKTSAEWIARLHNQAKDKIGEYKVSKRISEVFNNKFDRRPITKFKDSVGYIDVQMGALHGF